MRVTRRTKACAAEVAGAVQASMAKEAVLGSSRSVTYRGSADKRGNGSGSAKFEPQR